jgi:DHA2 family multidrug resistance protein
MAEIGFRKWFTLAILVISTFMAILDSSIVNIALPKMMNVFGASTEEIEWVLTGYMLTMGVIIPLTGYLGSRFGLKKVYVFALIMFTIGSALCGMAWNTSSMIAARVVQAIGGGMMMPVSMTIIFNIFPKEKMGTVLGIWGLGAVIAPAIGPTLSGYIIEYLDWRLIFTINIPIGIFATFLAIFFLDKFKGQPVKGFDYLGTILVSVGLFTLLLGLNKGNDKGWYSIYIISLLAVASMCLIGFVINELFVEHPLLDLRILKNFSFSLSLVITIITTIAMFGGIFIIPLFLQNLKGLSAMQTGMLMFPSALASALTMPISGGLNDKFGARPVAIAGMSILVVTTFILTKITLATDTETIKWLMMLRGFGMGLCMMPIQTAGMAEIPKEQTGYASAIANTMRQVGGSLGIAILASVMSGRQVFHNIQYTNNINYFTPEAQNFFSAFHNNILSKVVLVKNIAMQSYVASIEDTLWVAAIISLFGLALCFFIKKKEKANPPVVSDDIPL